MRGKLGSNGKIVPENFLIIWGSSPQLGIAAETQFIYEISEVFDNDYDKKD